MKKVLVVLGVMSSFVLTGCGEETKTIEYYSNHLDEAKTVSSDCEKKTATLSENCKNAMKAVSDDNFDKLINGGIKY